MSSHSSPVKRFPGEVVLPDYLTLPQCLAWSRAFRALMEVVPTEDYDLIDNAILPGIVACVSEWRLTGLPSPLTVDNFPGSPRLESNQLISWVIGLISDLYRGEEVPNG